MAATFLISMCILTQVTNFQKGKTVKYGLVILVIGLLMISGCGMELTETPEAKYLAETKQMKMIKDHQVLRLEILKVNREIAALQAEANKNMPTFELTPAKPE